MCCKSRAGRCAFALILCVRRSFMPGIVACGFSSRSHADRCRKCGAQWRGSAAQGAVPRSFGASDLTEFFHRLGGIEDCS